MCLFATERGLSYVKQRIARSIRANTQFGRWVASLEQRQTKAFIAVIEEDIPKEKLAVRLHVHEQQFSLNKFWGGPDNRSLIVQLKGLGSLNSKIARENKSLVRENFILSFIYDRPTADNRTIAEEVGLCEGYVSNKICSMIRQGFLYRDGKMKRIESKTDVWVSVRKLSLTDKGLSVIGKGRHANQSTQVEKNQGAIV